MFIEPSDVKKVNFPNELEKCAVDNIGVDKNFQFSEHIDWVADTFMAWNLDNDLCFHKHVLLRFCGVNEPLWSPKL